MRMKVMSSDSGDGNGSDESRCDESGDEDDGEEDEDNEVVNDEDDITEIENEDAILAVISDRLEDETRCPTKTRSGRNIIRHSEIDFSFF